MRGLPPVKQGEHPSDGQLLFALAVLSLTQQGLAQHLVVAFLFRMPLHPRRRGLQWHHILLLCKQVVELAAAVEAGAHPSNTEASRFLRLSQER